MLRSLSAIVLACILTVGSLQTAVSTPLVKRLQAGPHFAIYADHWLNSPPSGATLKSQGINTFILAFDEVTWYADNAESWREMSDAARKAVKADYAANGIKLLVSAFGSTGTPTSSGMDPTSAANTLADHVKTLVIDGVDLDYEDFAAFNAGKAEAWIIAFTKALRAALPAPYIITHAPVAPWFTDNTKTYPNGGYLAIDRAVGSLIDYYIVQFYNQEDYTTCDTLLNKSTHPEWAHSSLFEIAANGVPLNKLVIAKPASPGDANNGYVDPNTLATCISQAHAKGWSAGLALWQWPNQGDNFFKIARGNTFPL